MMSERQAKLGRADQYLSAAERLATDALEDLREAEPDYSQWLGKVLVELRDIKRCVREAKKWPADSTTI